ncbi:unnamed protein product [Amoebophrya sp. A120]|nr:unnamed protein product [Amoebophrya sp. A120]|eukprot:GSA120T00017809001.1
MRRTEQKECATHDDTPAAQEQAQVQNVEEPSVIPGLVVPAEINRVSSTSSAAVVPPRPQAASHQPGVVSSTTCNTDKFAAFRARVNISGFDKYFADIGLTEKLQNLEAAVLEQTKSVFAQREERIKEKRANMQKKFSRVAHKVAAFFQEEAKQLVDACARENSPTKRDALILEFVENKERVVAEIQKNENFLLRKRKEPLAGRVEEHRAKSANKLGTGAPPAASRRGESKNKFRFLGAREDHASDHDPDGTFPKSTTRLSGPHLFAGRGRSFPASIIASALNAETYAEYRKSLAFQEPGGTRTAPEVAVDQAALLRAATVPLASGKRTTFAGATSAGATSTAPEIEPGSQNGPRNSCHGENSSYGAANIYFPITGGGDCHRAADHRPARPLKMPAGRGDQAAHQSPSVTASVPPAIPPNSPRLHELFQDCLTASAEHARKTVQQFRNRNTTTSRGRLLFSPVLLPTEDIHSAHASGRQSGTKAARGENSTQGQNDHVKVHLKNHRKPMLTTTSRAAPAPDDANTADQIGTKAGCFSVASSALQHSVPCLDAPVAPVPHESAPAAAVRDEVGLHEESGSFLHTTTPAPGAALRPPRATARNTYRRRSRLDLLQVDSCTRKNVDHDGGLHDEPVVYDHKEDHSGSDSHSCGQQQQVAQYVEERPPRVRKKTFRRRDPSKLFAIDFWQSKLQEYESQMSTSNVDQAQERQLQPQNIMSQQEVVETAFIPLQQKAAYHDLTELTVLPVKFDSTRIASKRDEDSARFPTIVEQEDARGTVAAEGDENTTNYAQEQGRATPLILRKDYDFGKKDLVGRSNKNFLSLEQEAAMMSRQKEMAFDVLVDENSNMHEDQHVHFGGRVEYQHGLRGPSGAHALVRHEMHDIPHLPLGVPATYQGDFSSMAADLLQQMRVSEKRAAQSAGLVRRERQAQARLTSQLSSRRESGGHAGVVS